MEPTWRLDRRDSGHLFWRRDSSPAPSRARVKFRCDVEVLEFWPREDEHEHSTDDCGDDDEEEERRLKEWRRLRSSPAAAATAAASSPAVVVAICLAAVVVTVSLPWLLVR